MQKVTFKYDLVSDYTASRNYVMEFDMSEMTMDEFLEEVQRFMMLIGYHPQAVKDVFSEKE